MSTSLIRATTAFARWTPRGRSPRSRGVGQPGSSEAGSAGTAVQAQLGYAARGVATGRRGQRLHRRFGQPPHSQGGRHGDDHHVRGGRRRRVQRERNNARQGGQGKRVQDRVPEPIAPDRAAPAARPEEMSPQREQREAQTRGNCRNRSATCRPQSTKWSIISRLQWPESINSLSGDPGTVQSVNCRFWVGLPGSAGHAQQRRGSKHGADC